MPATSFDSIKTITSLRGTVVAGASKELDGKFDEFREVVFVLVRGRPYDAHALECSAASRNFCDVSEAGSAPPRTAELDAARSGQVQVMPDGHRTAGTDRQRTTVGLQAEVVVVPLIDVTYDSTVSDDSLRRLGEILPATSPRRSIAPKTHGSAPRRRRHRDPVSLEECP
jgi:hypothetical protein